jgi:pimeloyl-ACP methyl ester carboxylesterase
VVWFEGNYEDYEVDLKRAELHVLDRCGHWAQTQRWDAMYPLILDHFLGE